MLAALSEEQQKWVPVMTLGSQDLHCVSFELMFELSQNMLLHVYRALVFALFSNASLPFSTSFLIFWKSSTFIPEAETKSC